MCEQQRREDGKQKSCDSRGSIHAVSPCPHRGLLRVSPCMPQGIQRGTGGAEALNKLLRLQELHEALRPRGELTESWRDRIIRRRFIRPHLWWSASPDSVLGLHDSVGLPFGCGSPVEPQRREVRRENYIATCVECSRQRGELTESWRDRIIRRRFIRPHLWWSASPDSVLGLHDSVRP